MKTGSAVLLSLFTFADCATHPVTDAVCVSQCFDSWDNARVLVWTNEPKIEPLLMDWIRKQGGQVIDSAIASDSMSRRRGTFASTTRRIVGANRVLAATVERRSYPVYNLYSGYKEGHPRVTTLFDPTVTIRNMHVTDEMTQWSITVRGGSNSFVYDPAVTELAETALERAACEANPDTRWMDDRRCVDKSLF